VAAEVYESGAQPGGVAGTVTRDGFLCELGPNGFLDNREAIMRLCADLGLADELVRANPASADRFLFLGERLQKLPGTPGEFLRSAVLSKRGRARFLLERLLGRRGPEDESIRSFGVRHFGAEAADNLLDAVVTGIYAGAADLLSFPACFPRLAALEREHGSMLKAQAARPGRRRWRAEP
jgi:protoporphyrinogen/coproporphyrinogen III oxidase